MKRKKLSDYVSTRGLLSRAYTLLAVLLLALGMAACDDDTTDFEPTSTFKLYLGEENIVEIATGAPDYYPPKYQVMLAMEDLPADEKIIYMGSVYSIENPEPDLSDNVYLVDYSNYDTFLNWDWEQEPLYWQCLRLEYPIPNATYYVRGYVQTNKAEYYSNTVEVRSSLTAPPMENPDAYEIPVIFHLFPDAEGNYPVKDWMVKEQLDYANLVYGNYYNIPGQVETGVRFVTATHAPDGTPLETPGIVRETDTIKVDLQNFYLDPKYIWDMEYALNVWVCPFYNWNENGDDIACGTSVLPFFDEDEVLEGCYPLEPDAFAGIFINPQAAVLANNVITFAHEAGHVLGLNHVFLPGGDYCDDTPWYDRDAYLENLQGSAQFFRQDETGEMFWSDNVMDYYYSFTTGFTPDQVERMHYTLQHAYFMPGEAGKVAPALRSTGQPYRFRGKLVW